MHRVPKKSKPLKFLLYRWRTSTDFSKIWEIYCQVNDQHNIRNYPQCQNYLYVINSFLSIKKWKSRDWHVELSCLRQSVGLLWISWNTLSASLVWQFCW